MFDFKILCFTALKYGLVRHKPAMSSARSVVTWPYRLSCEGLKLSPCGSLLYATLYLRKWWTLTHLCLNN